MVIRNHKYADKKPLVTYLVYANCSSSWWGLLTTTRRSLQAQKNDRKGHAYS